MRDDAWLFQKLDEVWDRYFPDVPQENDVKIVWGRRARTRLGSIKKGGITSSGYPLTIITINSLFKNKTVPEYVILATIAHELAHYAHGFHSPLEQKFASPHAGGIIKKEFHKRGLLAIYQKQKVWLKNNWRNFVQKEMNHNAKARRKIIIKWI